MELVVADAADEAFLLDLLNTTPVVDGTVRDELAESGSGAALDARTRHRGDEGGGWRRSSRSGRFCRRWCEVKRGATALKPFVAGVALRPVAGPHGLDWRIEAGDAPASAVRAVLAWDALRISSPGAFGHVRTASAGCS